MAAGAGGGKYLFYLVINLQRIVCKNSHVCCIRAEMNDITVLSNICFVCMLDGMF